MTRFAAPAAVLLAFAALASPARFVSRAALAATDPPKKRASPSATAKRPAAATAGAAEQKKRNAALAEAVHKNDVAQVKRLLARGANPNGDTPDGSPYLVGVAARKDETLVAALLQAGADPNRADRDGFSPLMAAATGGSLPIVNLLLAKGARPNAIPGKKAGMNALSRAVFSGNVEVVKRLLDADAAINARSDQLTALMAAAAFGHEAITRLLLERGAYPALRNEQGYTALYIAEQEGHTAIANLAAPRHCCC